MCKKNDVVVVVLTSIAISIWREGERERERHERRTWVTNQSTTLFVPLRFLYAYYGYSVLDVIDGWTEILPVPYFLDMRIFPPAHFNDGK